MNLEQARFNMIEQQIRPWDVLNTGVLELLAVVRRENFVPPEHRALAFVDTEVPLRSSSGGAECMLAPKVEARLLQELDVRKHEHVLEIGAGSGYMAALLAHKAQHVTTLEIDRALARFARANLERAGMMNVDVIEADGSVPLPGEGPYDVILLSGSVAEVPAALLAQLKDGGRLAAIVGHEPVMRALLMTRRGAVDGVERRVLFDTVAQRLRNFPEPPRFRF